MGPRELQGCKWGTEDPQADPTPCFPNATPTPPPSLPSLDEVVSVAEDPVMTPNEGVTL